MEIPGNVETSLFPYIPNTYKQTLIFKVQTLCLYIELSSTHHTKGGNTELCSMRSLVTRVILLVHNQGTRLSWKITWENSWQHCPWPVSRHQRQKIKKEVSKGCICLKRNADLLVTHSMALGGLKKGLYPAPRKSSISPPDTDGSGWSILSFASGSKASVQSNHTTKIAI